MSVLVLNYDYQPIHITSWRRAFVLIYLRKAEIIESHPTQQIVTMRAAYPWPRIIRLLRYVPVPYRHVPLTRENIFKRDGYRCVYCGSSHHLTIDHVVPRSQGGEDTWENLVTACEPCNRRKGNRTPEQAGMRFLRRPHRPHYLLFWLRSASEIDPAWHPYLMLTHPS